MTIAGILCLFFIPLFEYCNDIMDEGRASGNQDEIDRARRLMLLCLWLNFIFAIFYALEIAMKSYAYGIRRAYS